MQQLDLCGVISDRLEVLSPVGDLLAKISQRVNFEELRQRLAQGFNSVRRVVGGRPLGDEVAISKLQPLKSRDDWSSAQVEEQLRGRFSLTRLLRLSLLSGSLMFQNALDF